MSRNFLHFIFFIIIIFGSTSLFYLCYNKIFNTYEVPVSMSNFNIQNTSKPQFVSFKIAFISDSHLNEPIFPILRNSIEMYQPNLVIHTGDLSNFGSSNELLQAKNEIESLNFKYVALPGDHDVAQTSTEDNFNMYFSYPVTYLIEDNKILFIPNYFNFTPFSTSKLNTFLNQIEDSDIIVTSQPIYVDPNNIFADKYMGSPTAYDNLSQLQKHNLETYLNQRNLILSKLRLTKKPKLVISGDHHRTSDFSDPENSLIRYHILGSLSKYIYLGKTQLLQSSLQSNRYTQLDILKTENKEFRYEIRDVELPNFQK